MALQNWEAQLDECQALESIYGPDFKITLLEGVGSLPKESSPSFSSLCAASLDTFSSCPPNNTWLLSCELTVRPTPPATGLWEIALDDGSHGLTLAQRVRHLPAMKLSVTVGPDYPSERPPTEYTVSALWLSDTQAINLKRQLTGIWETQGPGMPVVYSFGEYLQEEALEYLTRGGGPLVLETRNESCELNDERSEVHTILGALRRYSATEDLRIFLEGFHTCGVCFDEKQGDRFVRLECGHAFCLACLTQQSQIHVTEGSLDALRCPDPDCRELLDPNILREQLLAPDEYARWENLLLQRTLDTMSDTAYCPRCGTVSLEDQSENTADCPKCFYVFCTLCNEGRHPGVQCVSAETRLEMLRRKAEGGGAAAVAELRKREHEIMSLAEIEKTSKPCPSCGMAIQRSEGCNKMVCIACSGAFCYLCGKKISGYEHFRAGGTCVLFDEAEILRWERRWEAQVGAHDAAAFRNEFWGGFDERFGREPGPRDRAPMESANCPCCGQLNYKFARNNHMQCWSCMRHFCAVCRVVLHRRGGSHFGPGGCKQHS